MAYACNPVIREAEAEKFRLGYTKKPCLKKSHWSKLTSLLAEDKHGDLCSGPCHPTRSTVASRMRSGETRKAKTCHSE